VVGFCLILWVLLNSSRQVIEIDKDGISVEEARGSVTTQQIFHRRQQRSIGVYSTATTTAVYPARLARGRIVAKPEVGRLFALYTISLLEKWKGYQKCPKLLKP